MEPKITKFSNGNIKRIEYFNDENNLHREDGPAWIGYHSNGNIMINSYYIDNKCHRTDGPAFQSFHENGSISFNVWYINNKRHRIDGPAYIEYNEFDKPIIERYFINGIQLTKQEFIIHNRKRKLEIINRQ